MPSNSRAHWTAKAVKTLRRMREERKSRREIADALGPDFSLRSISDKIASLNLPPLPHKNEWPKDLVDSVTAMWKDGKSAGEIAKAIGNGMTRNRVIGKVHRLNLDKRPSKLPKPGGVLRHRARKVVARKTPTLPPLPINRPDILADKPPKAEAFVPLPDAPQPEALIDLGPHECHWPIGENPTLFCGCAAEKTYCAAHAKMAYREQVAETDRRRNHRARQARLIVRSNAP